MHLGPSLLSSPLLLPAPAIRPPQTFFYLEDLAKTETRDRSELSSAPPADGYRVLFDDPKDKKAKKGEEAAPALPTVMHNFTHRIKHSGRLSRVDAAGWEGGSRLSFELRAPGV